MLEWADVWKIALGFASSLVLIWVRECIVHYRQLRALEKSLWSMMEFESDLEAFVGALERLKTSIEKGKIRLVGFDVPKTITSTAEELAHLDPEHAYLYNELHSAAELVRSGLSSLREFVRSLATMKPNPDDESRLRKVIVGQASILKGDRLDLGRAELRLLKHIKRHHRKLKQATIDKVEGALAKFQKDDYNNLFKGDLKPKPGASSVSSQCGAIGQ